MCCKLFLPPSPSRAPLGSFYSIPSLTCHDLDRRRQLQPYVSREVHISRSDMLDWPIAYTKTDALTSKRAGTFSDKGFDGEYYLQLAEFFEEKAKTAAAAGTK